VNRDRDPTSTRTFPATLIVTRQDGASDSIPIKIRTRGHNRRLPETCTFAPLRLEFAASPIGTVFEGQRVLKLATHCREVDEYEQYVLREYIVYRMFNVLTPRSFRARIARASYVDTSTKETVVRAAFFLEDDDDVARRLEGRVADLQRVTFQDVDADAIMLLTLFEYMIGNTDVSMYVLHNIRLVRARTGVLYPIPYDFDSSGLVDAEYAVPDEKFDLPSVRERFYLGPCRTAEDLQPFFAQMRAARPDVMALYGSMPGLDPRYRNKAGAYLDQFYRTIDRPGDVKRAFIEGCKGRVGL
jgi:hypothetical protein